MVRLVEMEGKMNERGCIEIPAAVLGQVGICTGDSVKLIYMAGTEGLQNENREFLLLREAQEAEGDADAESEELAELRIPRALLADASIPEDCDLDIVCQEGQITILPAEEIAKVEVPDELLALLGELGISEEKVKVILRTAEEDEKESV